MTLLARESIHRPILTSSATFDKNTGHVGGVKETIGEEGADTQPWRYVVQPTHRDAAESIECDRKWAASVPTAEPVKDQGGDS